MTAYELRKKGIDVAIVERARVPRYKLCGGGVTWKAARSLPFDIAPIVQRAVHQVTLRHDGRVKLSIRHESPLVYMTMRDEFDAFLAERAQGEGAELLDGDAVRQITIHQDGISVETDSRSLRCAVLVGADGAHSRVAQALGIGSTRTMGLGLETEFPVRASELADWQDSLHVDVGRIGKGYGWIFPKRDHLSVGAAAEGISYRQLNAYFDRLISSELGLERTGTRTRGHFLPLRERRMPVQRGRVLLVGDAAGLIDPLTGEGIFYAIRSAQIAAGEIALLLAGMQPDFRSYEKRVDEAIMPDMATSLLIMRFVATMPGLAIALLDNSHRLQDDLCKLIRGA